MFKKLLGSDSFPIKLNIMGTVFKVKVAGCLIIVGAAALLLMFFIFILIQLLSPIAGFLFGGTFTETDRSKNTYSNAVLDKEEYWLGYNVQIDKELINAIALYTQAYGDTQNIDIDCLDPNSKDCAKNMEDIEKSKFNIENGKRLADGMVKWRILYSCRNRYEETETICTEAYLPKQHSLLPEFAYLGPYLVENTNGSGQNCQTITNVYYGDPQICGYDDPTLCDSVCNPGYRLEEEKVYELKSKEEFIEWLKMDSTQDDGYGNPGFDMEQFLIDLEITLPSDPEKREEFIDDAIDEMYSMYYSVTQNSGVNGGSSGSSVISAGMAGKIPEEVLEALQHPLGGATCTQTACFGVYSSPNCTGHIGVDIVSTGNVPIYSIAAGTVVHTTRNSKQCNPTFGGGGRASCGLGCEGTQITIAHDLIIDGKPVRVYSKYAHLSVLNPGLVEGAKVFTGQQLGLMGTTGCSTGTHLHFEILDSNQKNYNPEELLQYRGCNLNSSCEASRKACGF